MDEINKLKEKRKKNRKLNYYIMRRYWQETKSAHVGLGGLHTILTHYNDKSGKSEPILNETRISHIISGTAKDIGQVNLDELTRVSGIPTQIFSGEHCFRIPGLRQDQFNEFWMAEMPPRRTTPPEICETVWKVFLLELDLAKNEPRKNRSVYALHRFIEKNKTNQPSLIYNLMEDMNKINFNTLDQYDIQELESYRQLCYKHYKKMGHLIGD